MFNSGIKSWAFFRLPLGWSARAPVLLFQKMRGKGPMDQRKSPADCELRSDAQFCKMWGQWPQRSGRRNFKEEAGQINYIALGISFFNIRKKVIGMLAGYLKKPLAAPNIFASFLLCLLQDIMFVACGVLSPSFRRQKLLYDTHNRLCDSITWTFVLSIYS